MLNEVHTVLFVFSGSKNLRITVVATLGYYFLFFSIFVLLAWLMKNKFDLCVGKILAQNQMRTLIYQNDIDLRTFLQKIPNLTVTLYVFGNACCAPHWPSLPHSVEQDERRSMRGSANQMLVLVM